MTTDRQREVLRFMTDFLHEFGYPPTLDEIARAIGVKSKSTAHSHVLALVRYGHVELRRVSSDVTRYFPVEKAAA